MSVCHLNPHSSDFGDVCALYAPFLHRLTMQSSLFEPGRPVLVVACVARKRRPCPSHIRHRDRINLGLWRSLYKGGGVCLLKVLRISWGIQICMQNVKFFLTPDQTLQEVFLQKPPHMCVQNDQCDEGILLRYVCWGTRDPSSALPPLGGGENVEGLSGSTAAPGHPQLHYGACLL